jgi:hypothetical protein
MVGVVYLAGAVLMHIMTILNHLCVMLAVWRERFLSYHTDIRSKTVREATPTTTWHFSSGGW